MTPAPVKDPPIDVGAANAAVIDALLTHNWPELERLVPRVRVQDPCPDLDTPE